MAEFKKLSAVEAVEAVSETANVLIEENGIIKRAAKSEIGAQADWAETNSSSPAFIKNKPVTGKELIYEWTPGVDASGNPITDVGMFVQNIDEDLSWLASKMDYSDFEIVITQYGVYNNEDSDVVDSTKESTLVCGSTNTWIAFHKENGVEMFMTELGGMSINLNGLNYFEPGCMIGVYNKVQFDMDNGEQIPVEVGGCILCQSYPIKSIKIYKITY